MMSYYVSRIRLGELCRDIADMTWELGATTSAHSVDYDRVIAMDRRFDTLMEGLPASLSNNAGQEADRNYMSTRLGKQRYFAHSLMQARRCKLHLPWLLRVSQDERYNFSREACLQSARKMLGPHSVNGGRGHDGRIDLTKIADTRHTTFVPIKSIGILPHFFYATIVLVMDACVNRHGGGPATSEQQAEIRQACDILEFARSSSPMAGVLLDSLMAVLHKYAVRLDARDQASDGALPPMHGFDFSSSMALNVTMQENDAGAGFDALWQTYFDPTVDAGSLEWDALFNELDAQMIE